MAAKPHFEQRAHVPVPLRSSVPGLVPVRIEGITYLVPAVSAEAFRVKLAKEAKENARYRMR